MHAANEFIRVAHRDVYTTANVEYESFKSIAIQHAAHRYGITEADYYGWCRYYRNRFEQVGPAELSDLKQKTLALFERNPRSHPHALYRRCLSDWETHRESLVRGFADEYRHRRG
jgi:phage anti-repressor protein